MPAEPRQRTLEDLERDQSWAAGKPIVRSFLEDHPAGEPLELQRNPDPTPGEVDFCPRCGGVYVVPKKGRRRVCSWCRRPEPKQSDHADRKEVSS
ncbi:MAG TPA: hypothetical protein VGR13_07615 [Actinomycetota bacterium]|nr:hypothetical protein [Actinomycetota bacterium]